MNKLFDIEDTVDPKFISQLLENNPNLNKKFQEDFEGLIENINYKNLINFYNPKINLKEFETNNDGVMKSVNKILEETEYIESENEGNYFKNICDLIAMKHLLNVINKSKMAIESSMNKLKVEINTNKNQKTKFKNLSKKNTNEIMDEEEEIAGNYYKNFPRPQTANPSGRINNERSSRKFLEEGTFISFGGNPITTKMNSSFLHDDLKLIFVESNSENDYNNKMNINLISSIWPKSRTLLIIISKMYSEKYISAEQRGLLKEMIIDRDDSLTQFLNEYEISGDSILLYRKIIELSKEKSSTIKFK